MLYYRELDIDCAEVSRKLLNYIRSKEKSFITGFWTNTDTQEVISYIPELVNLFSPLNLTIKKISFITTSVKEGIIHVDDFATAPKARINLPILNCQDSETIFYTSKENPKHMKLGNGIIYYGLSDDVCTKICSFTLSKPTVIRPTELHKVKLNSDKVPRISCTVEFVENIENLLE